MRHFRFPALLCDIGGTNARFYWAADRDSPAQLLAGHLTAEFPTWAEALHAAIARVGRTPASLLVCAAGPIAGRSVNLTNCSWRIDGERAAREFGIRQGLLLNDFEALAYAVADLQPGDAEAIGADCAVSSGDGVRAVIGPGTGLGVAALATSGGRHIAIPSEGGHAGLPASCPREAAIFDLVETPSERLTIETILSGPGLVRLHRARAKFLGLEDLGSAEAAEIACRAGENPHGAEADTIRHFWRIAANVAGDLALIIGARQGVMLAGGVLPKLRQFLSPADFRTVFEARQPMSDFCRAIPTQLLMTKTAAIDAMRRIAARPDSFALDFEARCWT